MLRDSIPGTPGEDYPIYADAPETKFECEGRVNGGQQSLLTKSSNRPNKDANKQRRLVKKNQDQNVTKKHCKLVSVSFSTRLNLLIYN